MRLLDAHVHLWRLADGRRIWIREKIAALHRDFTLEDLGEAQAGRELAGSIVVQAATDPGETEAQLAMYASEPRVRGIVGWVDLESDPASLSRRLAALCAHPKFVGVRVQQPRAFDIDWLVSAPVMRAMQVLAEHRVAVDFLVNCTQLAEFRHICGAIEGMNAVLDHGGRPFVMTGDLTAWRGEIQTLARETDASCKLSGLIERAGVEWTPESVTPWIGALLDTFGPQRLIYASNWPIMTLMGSYAGWLETLDTAFDALGVSSAERDAIYCGNAARTYGLPELH